MPKFLKKAFSAVFCVFLLAATVLRFVQLTFLTDVKTGFIKKDFAVTMLIFFALCCAIVVMAFCLVRLVPLKNPFEQAKSKLLFCTSIAAGVAMFYDFVHQCINCCNYFLNHSAAGLNYFVSLCLSALAALMCAAYFAFMGISFKTDTYDFRRFRYFHLMPALWNLFFIFSRLSDYNDGIYDEEGILLCAALIIGVLFFIQLALSVGAESKKIHALCFMAVLYGSLCVLLAVPRITALVFGADLIRVDFSAVTYLLMAVFAFSLPVAAQNKKM